MIKNVFKISSLFFLSIASFLFYYLEVIVHGWEGLKWTSNFYWSLLVVPFIFCIWLKTFVDRAINVKTIIKFLLSYFLTFIGIFILLNLIYNLKFSALLLFLPFGEILSPTIFGILIIISFFINVILIFLFLFFENLYLKKLLDFELSKTNKIILLFQPIYIFCIAEMVMILFYFLGIFPKMNKFNLQDSIFIFKTGTIIFSSVLCEGLYIIYKKRI